MAVCGADLRRHGKLSGNAIVATVMSNLGLHEYCRKEGIELVCTAVGDRPCAGEDAGVRLRHRW